MKKLTTRKLAYIALFMALVYIFSRFFQVPYVTPFGNTRFHLGNVFCLLAGILLGPVHGGLAAGLGSMLFDLFDPVYFTSAPTTFINKFLMAWVAGYFFYKRRNTGSQQVKVAISAILGQLTYIILYLAKSFISSYFIMGLTFEAAMGEIITKGGVSLINGILSVIFATILALPLLKNIKFE